MNATIKQRRARIPRRIKRSLWARVRRNMIARKVGLLSIDDPPRTLRIPPAKRPYVPCHNARATPSARLDPKILRKYVLRLLTRKYS